MAFARAGLTAARWAALAAALASRGAARHAAATAFGALYLYPTLRRNCAWHGPVVRSFATRKNEVWLTIDDGPFRGTTEGFAGLLADAGGRASFFCVGSRIARNPALAGHLVDAGHTIENHTFTHPTAWWWAAPPWTVKREISSASEAIKNATGIVPRFFRSPVGMNNPWVHRAAAAENMRVAGWSASAGDGCRMPPSLVAERLLAQVRPGAVLLLHEGDRPRHRLLSLKMLLEGLARRGYRCVLPQEFFGE